MPADVHKYARLPVLRLKLTSVMTIRNPRELLKNSEGAGQVVWDYPEKIHGKRYNSSLVQILCRLNVAVFVFCFYTEEPLNVTCSQESLYFGSDLHRSRSCTDIITIHSDRTFARASENGQSCIVFPIRMHDQAVCFNNSL